MAENLEKKGHEGRNDLIGEHKWGDLGQMILLVIFLVNWVLDSFILHYSTGFSDYVPIYIRLPLAIVVTIFSFWFAKSGLDIVFGEVREKPEVIQKGVFGVVRHPVYFGAVIGYLGLFFFSLSISSLILFMLIFIFYDFVAGYEEKLLTVHLGQDYLEYKKKVSRWIPKFKKS